MGILTQDYSLVIHNGYSAYVLKCSCHMVNFITVNKSLEHVQRLVYLYITSAIRTTPNIALELIIGLVPLPVFVQEKAMNTCYHLFFG